MSEIIDIKSPVFFQSNRVWRCYKGGILLDQFMGNPSPIDDNFPEDWLASTTIAQNRENQQSPDEGLSIIRLSDGTNGPYFKDFLASDPKCLLGIRDFIPENGIGVLCKFLDSAIRLPIQCHPDRKFARKYYKSNYGKTESWLILGTRQIHGEEPYILMGFKPDIIPEEFKKAVIKEDIASMENSLHRINVKPGDMYFIPGRIPHAIGPGVFLLEVQEPTDWVVQPERFIGDVELSHSDMWGPLEPENGLECFDYNGADSLENIIARTRLCPQITWQKEEGILERIIGPDITDCFHVDRLTVHGTIEYNCEATWHIAIITKGSGRIYGTSGHNPIKNGDCFFISNQIKSLKYQSNGSRLEISIITLGSKSATIDNKA